MFAKKIQKFIVKEIEDFYEDYKKENFDNESDEGTAENELIKKLIDHFSPEKKPKKELPDEERCIAITSKKTRCTSKKTENDLCKIHNQKGTNHGVVGEEVPKKEKKEKKEKTVENPCQYMFTRGKDAGTKCNKEAQPETTVCKKHQPKKSIEKIPEDSYNSEEMEKTESKDVIGSDEDDNSDDN